MFKIVKFKKINNPLGVILNLGFTVFNIYNLCSCPNIVTMPIGIVCVFINLFFAHKAWVG